VQLVELEKMPSALLSKPYWWLITVGQAFLGALSYRIPIQGIFYCTHIGTLVTYSLPIPRTLSWTGWLLVLVYFGGLTAVSTFVVHNLLGIEELLFYEVFFKVLLFTAIVYILTSVHNGLEKKKWTEKRSDVAIKALAVVFAIIGVDMHSLDWENPFH
jgi:hypothetical protein